MKKILALVALAAIAIPTTVSAAVYKAEDSVTIAASETVSDDLYIAGGNLSIDGTVNGDVFAAGGTILVTGTINGDLTVAGGTVTLRGKVSDDVRVMGGQLTITSTIGDDLLVAAGEVSIERDAVVGGEVKVGSGDLKIAGTVGAIDASADTISLAETAKVNGNFRYWSAKQATIPSGAVVTGQTIYEKVDYAETSKSDAITTSIIGAIATALFAWALSRLFPNRAKALIEHTQADFGKNVLWGTATMILTPLAALILALTIIGAPLAIVILLALPFFYYMGWLVAVLAFGFWLYRGFSKATADTTDLWAWGLISLVGSIGLALVGMIPFIGWLITSVAFVYGFGAMIRSFAADYKKLR